MQTQFDPSATWTAQLMKTNKFLALDKWHVDWVRITTTGHVDFICHKGDKLGNIRGRTTSKNTTCVIAGRGTKEYFLTLQLESLDSS